MYVKVDLAYRVAYLVDDQGVDQRWQSGITKSNVNVALESWGYTLMPGSHWEATDILNAIDAMQRPVEPIGN